MWIHLSLALPWSALLFRVFLHILALLWGVYLLVSGSSIILITPNGSSWCYQLKLSTALLMSKILTNAFNTIHWCHIFQGLFFSPHNTLWGYDLHTPPLSNPFKAISGKVRFLLRTMKDHWTIAQKQAGDMMKGQEGNPPLRERDQFTNCQCHSGHPCSKCNKVSNIGNDQRQKATVFFQKKKCGYFRDDKSVSSHWQW